MTKSILIFGVGALSLGFLGPMLASKSNIFARTVADKIIENNRKEKNPTFI